MKEPRLVSVVIPFYNEAPSLATLVGELEEQREHIASPIEYVLVDDGSSDDGLRVVAALKLPHVRLIRLRRRFGKAIALAAGFQAARGDIIVTMDADLQDNPANLPGMLKTIAEGYDVVNGWKVDRRDPPSRRVASFLYNKLVGLAVGRVFHDVNSGYKAYRRWVIEGLRAYGENHRILLLNAALNGARIIETPVTHRPRIHGHSKYRWNRFFSALMDFWWLLLSSHFFYKPLHFFGLLGLGPVLLGVAALTTAVAGNIVYGTVWLRPLSFFGALLILGGLQLISIGLIAEYVLALRLRLDNPAAFTRWISAYEIADGDGSDESGRPL